MMGNRNSLLNFIFIKIFGVALMFLFSVVAFAGTDGTITGAVFDDQGVAIDKCEVQLVSPDGRVIKEGISSSSGDFVFFPVTFGDYQVLVKKEKFNPLTIPVHVSSGSTAPLGEIRLIPKTKEMVLNVEAKKRLVKHSASVSSAEISKDDIATMPQGESIHLPKLLSSTMPGAVRGAFGQTFIRGNHANIQYQIDGVQLPDSPSNTFGDSFTPRNIDHMEFITGGVAAEYGQRLAAVVNIVTKSGAETPGGEAEVNYGSWNAFSPFAIYSGSSSGGDIHYFLSASYFKTDRGLDTPQPQSEIYQDQGGRDAIHDQANGNNEFAKIDWLMDNSNKFSLSMFNSYGFYQIPNYPGTFLPTDNFFQPTSGFTDEFGNGTFNYVPPNTDDSQYEINSYAQVVWKHSFSDHQFLQVAPYFKYSYINVKNDPTNDLFATNGPLATQIPGSTASSFAESKNTNNYGLKADFTDRMDDHLLKFGVQGQNSQSGGFISVLYSSAPNTPPTSSLDNSPTTSNFESVYAQDEYTISKSLILNAGLRFDATQLIFGGGSTYSADSLLQPRIGLNYFLTDTTKIHGFYGKLFQPAPAENLRDTFGATSGTLAPYDIKAEKDDYYEVGIDQQWGDQLLTLNTYYKNAVNQLDDAQLLNTSIAQPYNFQMGYAYGTEFSIRGKVDNNWSDFLNYSYEIAKGKGIGGGIFAFPPGTSQTSDWQYLDHVQIHTVNAGATYATDRLWWTIQTLLGSGLRTGPGNSNTLPPHLTFDTTFGYKFTGASWFERFKVSADILNILDNPYPISVANGFNGSHYAAGREFIIHLNKEL